MSWEAPTMRSKTSYFNKTVFWSECRHYWPLTAGFALLWLLILPMPLFTELNNDPARAASYGLYDTLSLTAQVGYWLAFGFGVLFAMAAFAYLTNPRATNGLHALPARRETLYVTHYLAGLAAQLAGEALAVALAAAVLASHNIFDARVLGLSLLALMLPTVFFYSFGVLCVMFTGQALAAPVFYAVLNVLVVGVEILLRELAGNFLYGWAGDSTPVLTPLSPIVQLVETNVNARRAPTYFGDAWVSEHISLQGLGWLGIYAAVGLVCAALGLLLYRKRHSEATGDTVAIAWARPVFQYGVAFCAALALGQLLYELFFGRYRARADYSLPGALACMAAAGLLGFFATEMLLKKSFRVLRSGCKGALIVTAVLVAVGFGMTLDLTGYESYVPNAGEVTRAYVEWSGYYAGDWFDATLESEDVIRLAAEAHRAVARDKQRQLTLGNEQWEGLSTIQDTERQERDRTRGTFYIRYTLKSGRSVARRYGGICVYAAELNDPASPAAALDALYNAETVMLQRAIGLSHSSMNMETDPRALTDLRFTGGYVDLPKWREDEYIGSEQIDLSPAEAKAVYDAILRDAAADRMSTSIFTPVESSARGRVELYAVYTRTPESVASAGVATPADTPRGSDVWFYPEITPMMTETLAALRAAGVEMEFYD